MMNCLDVRRMCLAEPHSRSPRLLLHVYHCKACRQYRNRILAAEEQIHSTMNVPAPEGLGRKVMFDTGFDEAPARRRGWMYAAAATAMSALLVLASLVYLQTRPPDVVPDLARHMVEDPLHIQPPEADADQRLDEVVRHLGGKLAASPSNVLHATLCMIRDLTAAHLVVRGQQGPVTVFVIPRHRVRSFERINIDGQIGMVADYGEGSIALFGYEGESLEAVRAQFSERIRWTARYGRDAV